ncbi:MAG: hypothetical protein VX938_01600, partial [Myxococcota bacterium]|nr:hypothetical protein [Myxococcota bacterium]
SRPQVGDPNRDPTGWTQQRAAIIAATLMEGLDASEEGGRALQEAVRVRAVGERGASLSAVVQLQLAALAHRGEAYKEAIAGYLRVPMDSGYWREARLGLAWCQLRIGQPERTLKIIALLPGGLSGEPERAMLAAMAAHSMGHGETARTILIESRSIAQGWEPDGVTVEDVLAALSRREDVPRLRESEETMLKILAGQGPVRSAGRELLATRGEQGEGSGPPDPAMMALEARQLDALRVVLNEAREAQGARLKQALAEIELLLPQLN